MTAPATLKADRLPDFEIDVSAEAVTRWLIARDGGVPASRPAGPVPLSFLFFLRIQPARALSIHEVLGRNPDRGLMGGVRYERGAGVEVGDRLSASPRIVARTAHDTPDGPLYVGELETAWRRGDGAVAVTETVRMIDLPTDRRPAAPPKAPDAALAPVAEIGPLGRNRFAWMTVVTGDLNPLHLDAGYAARRGYDDVVAPGPLLAAVFETALADHLGGPLARLDVRLAAAVHPDTALSLRAGAADGGGVRFQAVTGDRITASGTARR